MNAHDLDAFVDCFGPDYRSDQPAHPDRAFTGRDQVRANWASVFAGVPNFTAELLVSASIDGGIEIAEWSWSGTHSDGSPFAMCGMTVMGIEEGRIAWGRLYMELRQPDGADIDQMVQETYRPPGSEQGAQQR